MSAEMSMLDAIRHAVETGDALRPAAWGSGFYLLISPQLSSATATTLDSQVRLEHCRLRNPATRADHPLDVGEMLGPWVTLPVKQAQAELSTRYADGEEA